jgi:hypothetical protein
MFCQFQKFNIFTTIVLTVTILSSCQTKTEQQVNNPKIFPGFKYTKAVAYDYDGSEQGDLIIEKGKIHPSVKKQIELNQEQTEELLSILNDSLSYGEDVTRCFKPHLGFVFYDEHQKAKSQISICFLCNQHNSFPLISAQESVRKSHPNSSYGYSKQGRKKLITLCQELGFSNCSFTENN